jgi:hypothetical protein
MDEEIRFDESRISKKDIMNIVLDYKVSSEAKIMMILIHIFIPSEDDLRPSATFIQFVASCCSGIPMGKIGDEMDLLRKYVNSLPASMKKKKLKKSLDME